MSMAKKLNDGKIARRLPKCLSVQTAAGELVVRFHSYKNELNEKVLHLMTFTHHKIKTRGLFVFLRSFISEQ